MISNNKLSKIDELIENQEKINYLLDALIDNVEKFNALPNKLQELLRPYKNKLEKNKMLDKEDYERLKKMLKTVLFNT